MIHFLIEFLTNPTPGVFNPIPHMPYLAIDPASDCGNWLSQLGWVGDPNDGIEAIVAPESVVNAVCN